MLSERIIRDIREEILPEFREDLKKIEGKTVLVTGGNGLIASYLIDTMVKFNEFSEKPIKFIIINKNDSNENSRLSHLLGNENIKFVTADVGRHFEIPEKVDIIMHAASRANPAAFLADPIDTIDANVNGIRTLLEYAKNNGVEQFIYFSSAEIYGNPVKEFIPTPENYNGNVDCLSKHACYIEAKRFSETLAMAYFRKYGVPVKFLRILLVYGPGMRDDGKVISDFFSAAIKNKKINIRDRGDATRSFCYVSEATRQILRVLFNGQFGEAYNIADDSNNVSILEIANMIAKIVNNGVVVSPNLDAPKRDIYGVDTRLADISKVKKLGFEVKVSLEEGLKRLKEHFEQTEYREIIK